MGFLDRLRGSHAPSIGPAEAYAEAQQGRITLLDVREHHEWQAGHAPGATHIPLDTLDPAAVPSDRPVVTVCRSGMRSARAAAILREAGHQVSNLTGGMTAWERLNLPTVRDNA